jgi:hypothetical protein
VFCIVLTGPERADELCWDEVTVEAEVDPAETAFKRYDVDIAYSSSMAEDVEADKYIVDGGGEESSWRRRSRRTTCKTKSREDATAKHNTQPH